MSIVIQTALLADGTSDKALIPVIRWTLRDLRPQGDFSRTAFFPRRHRDVAERAGEIMSDFRPDILFVHRDAENMTLKNRQREIPGEDRFVPLVPVRMTEAWLLFDETAIRNAASNPNGDSPIALPPLKDLEKSQAKTVLHDLLKQASGKTGRRLKSFNVERAVHRVAELIEDYSPLKRLPAYVAFSKRLENALNLVGEQSR